jgi:hypothetical protein
VLKYLPNLKRLSFYGVQRRNAGMCWAPVMTDLELDTIALLTGLEELNIGDGVGLGAPRPEALGPRAGEAECRITGGTRITDAGVAKLASLKKLRDPQSERLARDRRRPEDAGDAPEPSAVEPLECRRHQRLGGGRA